VSSGWFLLAKIQLVVLNNQISVKDASFNCGYSQQYLRRMMRNGKLPAVKIGQIWLLDKGLFGAFLVYTTLKKDRRF
jgi:hypothetical protein